MLGNSSMRHIQHTHHSCRSDESTSHKEPAYVSLYHVFAQEGRDAFRATEGSTACDAGLTCVELVAKPAGLLALNGLGLLILRGLADPALAEAVFGNLLRELFEGAHDFDLVTRYDAQIAKLLDGYLSKSSYELLLSDCMERFAKRSLYCWRPSKVRNCSTSRSNCKGCSFEDVGPMLVGMSTTLRELSCFFKLRVFLLFLLQKVGSVVTKAFVLRGSLPAGVIFARLFLFPLDLLLLENLLKRHQLTFLEIRERLP